MAICRMPKPSPRASPPPSFRALKSWRNLDIAERRLPQDGRIRIAVRGQDVVFRISTAPGLHGEIIVLRILDRSRGRLRFRQPRASPR